MKVKPIILLVCFIMLLSGCNEKSNNSIIKSAESPDQKYVAYIFVRDMGATTQSSYQLSILKKGKSLGNVKGNAFISYGSFDVDWNSENELVVTKNEKAKIFKQETKYDEINISYNP